MKILPDRFDAIESLCPDASFAEKQDEEGNYYIIWNSPDIPQPSDKEVEAELARLLEEEPKKEIRELRDKKLLETDWVVIQSQERNTEISKEWKLYRQALRDIPSQSGFPSDVEWPTKPK